MELIMETDLALQKYRAAQKQVKEIKGFYSHLSFYIIFNGIIIFINLRYSPEVLWFFWTTFSWGIGLLFHAVRVFQLVPFMSKNWEARKIKEFMDQEKNEQIKYQ